MIAFALVILIFSFWSLVGLGLVSTLYRRPNLLQSALLSPAVGLAATVLLVAWLNTAGLPLRYGGPIATVGLLVLSAALLRRRRPVIPARRLLPFAGAVLVAALATGYPLLRFGFNWVSYCNDDMANYCLGAKLFLNHAQFAVPSAGDILADRDGSLAYWFFYVVGAVRHGADQLLAWLVSCTGLSPHQGFMPLILAFHLVLITSAGALVLQRKSLRRSAALTCLALGLSALTTLGTTYQLLAQVSGLALLTATCTVLLRPWRHKAFSEWAFSGMLAAALAMVYPEAAPFLVSAFLAYHALLLLRRKEALPDLARVVWPVSVFSVLFLNVTFAGTIVTVIHQSGVGMKLIAASMVLFPFYLTPAGFAYLWGFRSLIQAPSGSLLDFAIVAGAILLVAAICAALWLAWREEPVAFVFLIMAALSVGLFRGRMDFGLYKIAMYMQPFLLGTVVVAWSRLFVRFRKRRAIRIVWVGALTAMIGWGMYTQVYYTVQSLGQRGGGLVEIPNASASGVIAQLKQLPHLGGPVVSDTSNVVLAKFEAVYQGPLYFLAKDFVGGFVSVERAWWNPFYRVYGQFAGRVAAERISLFETLSFDMHGALPYPNRFVARRRIADDRSFTFLTSNPEISGINRRNALKGDTQLVKLMPLSAEKNFLAFIASEFGNSYYLAGPDRTLGRVSMYQPERDYFFPGQTMLSLGRDSLFRILNPSPRVRMVLEYTASLNGDRDNRIPAASVIGNERLMFPAKGRGSARLFSPPAAPQVIGGARYIALDMGSWGWSFPEPRSRIMSLFGRDVVMDGRRIVGFERDISVISEDQYAALRPPQSIQSFPQDLKSRDLEYSGIYEDGWAAETSEVVLDQPDLPSVLVISMSVPQLGGKAAASSLTVRLDGKEAASRPLPPGETTLRLPTAGAGKRRIELLFDRSVNLPKPDSRPVSALLRYVGFKEGSSK